MSIADNYRAIARALEGGWTELPGPLPERFTGVEAELADGTRRMAFVDCDGNWLVSSRDPTFDMSAPHALHGVARWRSKPKQSHR